MGRDSEETAGMGEGAADLERDGRRRRRDEVVDIETAYGLVHVGRAHALGLNTTSAGPFNPWVG